MTMQPSTAQPSTAALHHIIIETIIAQGHAPSPEDLARHFGCNRADISNGLAALEQCHGVVLHPGSDTIWVIHPFSLAPSQVQVRSAERVWWCPCIWCALGAAALVRTDVVISTALGAEGRHAQLRIEGEHILDTDYVVHFPIPMQQAWDNVHYTCAMMQLFADTDDVQAWCDRHAKPFGDVRPINQIWAFARDWYGRHRDADWRKWTAEEAAAIFARHDLSGPIWDLSSTQERF